MASPGAALLLVATYDEIPGYPLVFALVAGAIAYFVLATARHVRVMALARPTPLLGGVPDRIRSLVVYALAQVKMFKDVRAGLMHFAIFWGFVFLTIGTVDILTYGLVGALLAWPLDGLLWAGVALMQNSVAIVVLVAIAYAAWRRLVTKPARLTLSSGALVILGLIGGIVAAEVLAMTFEAVAFGPRPGAEITNAFASGMSALPQDLVAGAFVAAWWLHMVLIAAFICYLPGSKHLHIVTSFVNVFFRKLRPRGELPALDLEVSDQVFGVRAVIDFRWKDLLDGFTCTECGRCMAACPAHRTGKALNPKEMIMGIRHMAVEAEGSAPLLSIRPLAVEAVASTPAVVGDAISFEATWDCVTCGACVEACPVLIEHVDKIVDLRRNLVLEDSRFPAELSATFRNLERTGNPWGQPRSARMDWAKDLPFEVPTLRELASRGELDSIEVVYWVGCAAAFDERTKKVARAFASCLAAAGVRFAVLGPEESCTGDAARRCGNEYLYQQMATANIELLTRYAMERRTIVTTCPHCFNSLGVEYRQLGGEFTVLHHAPYLRQLLSEGRLRLGSSADAETVTLQDSCYLARYNNIVAEPRDVLRALPGVELREMAERGRSTFCCGAGGGRMWMEEAPGSRINDERKRQAIATGADTVVTECPFCTTMLRDGVAASDSRDIRILDLAEIVAARLPAAAPDPDPIDLATAAESHVRSPA